MQFGFILSLFQDSSTKFLWGCRQLCLQNSTPAAPLQWPDGSAEPSKRVKKPFSCGLCQAALVLPGADSNFRKAVLPPPAPLGTRVPDEVWRPCPQAQPKHTSGARMGPSLYGAAVHTVTGHLWMWQSLICFQLLAQENNSSKFTVYLCERQTKSAVDRKSSENRCQDLWEVTEKKKKNNMSSLPVFVLFAWPQHTWLFPSPAAL